MIPIEILTEPWVQTRYGRKLGQRALCTFVEEAAGAIRLRGAVSVLLTGDREIRRLNRAFRKKDQATDVLSFPAPADGADGHGRMAGDLAISVETAARQAEEQGETLGAELQILALHGLLHLAGFDHETDSGTMARKEAALRRRFGLGAGLIERAGKPTSAKTGQLRGTRRRPTR